MATDPHDGAGWGDDDGPDDDPVERITRPWGSTANPNTADGELQNMAAFSAGFSRLSGPRRTVAVVIVWLILLGFAITIGYGVVGIVRIW